MDRATAYRISLVEYVNEQIEMDKLWLEIIFGKDDEGVEPR